MTYEEQAEAVRRRLSGQKITIRLLKALQCDGLIDEYEVKDRVIRIYLPGQVKDVEVTVKLDFRP